MDISLNECIGNAFNLALTQFFIVYAKRDKRHLELAIFHRIPISSRTPFIKINIGQSKLEMFFLFLPYLLFTIALQFISSYMTFKSLFPLDKASQYYLLKRNIQDIFYVHSSDCVNIRNNNI